MSDPLLRDALRQIQDIVAEAKGSTLGSEAARRVEAVLKAVAAPEARSADTGYSRIEATILFADLRGFSALSAAYPADVVLGVLSSCFGLMTEIILRHYGTIDKFMGAVEMQIAMNGLRQQHHEDRLPEIYLGIGISTGTVMAGLIGSDAYRAFTVIGEEVNLAARIEAFSLRGQVLISEFTYSHCRDFIEASGPMEVYVKGKSERLGIREVHGIPELGKVVPRQEVRKSPRVETDLALEYRPLTGKVVASWPSRGVVRDLGYHGALVQLVEPLPVYSELKLGFDLPRLDFRAEEIYARVVSSREKGGLHFAGLEFSSLSDETASKIRLFVQMCIQGEGG